MKTIFKINQTNTSLSVSNIDKISRGIGIHLAKNKINKFTLAEKLGFKPIKCTSCGNYNPFMQWDISVDLSKCSIDLSGIFYKAGKFHKNIPYCFGSNKKCKVYNKNLNPNSSEFIELIFEKTKKEALEIIHTRNKTPFYKSNHSSEEEYTQYQSRSIEWFENNDKDRNEWIEKTKKGRNLSSFIKKYGPEIGIEKYQNFIMTLGCISKVEKFIEAFGNDVGRLNYIKRCSSVSNKMLVHNEESFYNYLYNHLIEKTILVKCKNYPIKNLLNYNSELIHAAKTLFYKDNKDLLNKLKFYHPDIHSRNELTLFSKVSDSQYINVEVSYTTDGIRLDSKLEAEFYLLLMINEIKPELHKKYENSNFISDFYINEIDTYIEIAGLMHLEHYKEKIESKKKLATNVIIVEPHTDKEWIIDIIKRKINEHKHKSN